MVILYKYAHKLNFRYNSKEASHGNLILHDIKLTLCTSPMMEICTFLGYG